MLKYNNKKTISFEEVKILTNLASNFENDDIINFSLSGEKARLKRMMEENNFSSVDSFILQKILNKKIHRLIKIKILQQNDKNTDAVINQIKLGTMFGTTNELDATKAITVKRLREGGQSIKIYSYLPLKSFK